MLLALICARRSPEPELGGTVLWRHNFERRLVTSAEKAREEVLARRPQIVVVERELPGAVRLVRELRQEPETRRVSIVVFANNDFDAQDAELLEAGANAILRLPPGPEWEDRLFRLMNVPVRKEARFPVHIQLEITMGSGEVFPALGLNLSTAGMLVQCARRLRVGEELSFALQLPGVTGLITGMGSVLRVEPSDRYGIEIAHLYGDSHRRIRCFVEGPGSDEG